MTPSCKIGSMRLRPDWPWRARKYKIAPDESGQYWYLFLFPPPLAMLFFHFVRPMMKVQEMFQKIIFYSPELIRSIIFSRKTSMTKKTNQVLWCFIIGDWIFSWFNIDPTSFTSKYGSCGWAVKAVKIWFLWFSLCLWSACKITCIQSQRIFFEL